MLAEPFDRIGQVSQVVGDVATKKPQGEGVVGSRVTAGRGILR